MMMKIERAPIEWALDTGVGKGIARRPRTGPCSTGWARRSSPCVCVVIALYALVKPDYNWDMVAYVATALEDRYQDPAELHAATWSEIEKARGRRNSTRFSTAIPTTSTSGKTRRISSRSCQCTA